MRRLPTGCVAFLLAALGAAYGYAQPSPESPSLRGVADTIEFQADGASIQAKPNQLRESPVLVRVRSGSKTEDGKTTYRAEVLGLVAGEYDLRDFIERSDGSPLGLEPIRFEVTSQLEGIQGVDLFTQADAPDITSSHYRTMLILIGVVWLSVPIVVVVRRRMNREPEVAPPPAEPEPTLADQLRPLVAGALEGTLSIREQGRLELLMYAHWRERLDLAGPQSVVVAQLRRDAQAGALLRAVEQWLHAGTSKSPVEETDVTELLRPYSDVAAIDVEQVVAPEGVA